MSSDSRSPDFPTPVGGADSPCEGHATSTSLRSATRRVRGFAALINSRIFETPFCKIHIL